MKIKKVLPPMSHFFAHKQWKIPYKETQLTIWHGETVFNLTIKSHRKTHIEIAKTYSIHKISN